MIGGDLGYLPDASAALAAQYGFQGLPTSAELSGIEPNKGMTFRLGKLALSGEIFTIDYFQVFRSGLSVATHTNTKDSDLILDHILGWARKQFKLELEPIRPGTAHSSQLEIRLEKSLRDLFPFLSSVGAAMSDNLDEWWEIRPPYELINVNFWIDKTKYSNFAPQIFRLDRRENVQFEQNVYYAEASLSTDKHIEVLTLFENACLDALK
ncbi:MAG: hypothetical protein Q7S58_19460 [Candidatus Binatus sp.]|uniref:hypothetical protein n=1 Tax=Candidatus Binatus sp. TaxID=2811406 RepID=UPI0027239374|nr:hypothetical protein [Candidatus Binatus sp.]MDO8434580.1 hypothetical protein [Candidatus Binatus sp.]